MRAKLLAYNERSEEMKTEICKPESPKKRLKREYKHKQWLLDNKENIFTYLDAYDNYFLALGRVEQKILELELEKESK